MKEDNYEEIINLPHYISKKHPQMSNQSRASQFAPFSALSGYSDAVKETARLTDKRIEIDEGLKNLLNQKLQLILAYIENKPKITFTYFEYDKEKTGGRYINVTGNVKKIDLLEQYVILTNKKRIPINEIINITEIKDI